MNPCAPSASPDRATAGAAKTVGIRRQRVMKARRIDTTPGGKGDLPATASLADVYADSDGGRAYGQTADETESKSSLVSAVMRTTSSIW